MPAGISALAAPFEPREREAEGQLAGAGILKAFTILQRDGLDSSLPLLHLNGGLGASDSEDTGQDEDEEEDDDDDDSLASGMTAIKRSLHSNVSSGLARRHMSRSSEDLESARRAGRGRLNLRTDPPARSMHLSTEDFNETLNAKLKRLQEQEEEDRRRWGPRPGGQALHPRPFITTVKSGEFLMPPPEVALLLGIAPSLPPGPTYAAGAAALTDSDLEGHQCRSRFRQQLVSLNRRTETRPQARNLPRSQVALKATEDFALAGATGASALASAVRRSNKDPHQM